MDDFYEKTLRFWFELQFARVEKNDVLSLSLMGLGGYSSVLLQVPSQVSGVDASS